MPKLGINFSLVQWDYLNLDIYAQAVAMEGLVERIGIAGGLRIRSFPGAGLVFEARVGFQDYENFKLNDSELRLGYLLDRYELCVGYRWLEAGYPHASGPFAGLRAWF